MGGCDLRPLGFEDWRVSTALITGFTAKEAVVSTMSVLLGTTSSQLQTALGSVFTPLTAGECTRFHAALYTVRSGDRGSKTGIELKEEGRWG